MGDLSPHFSRAEFRCHCGCGFADIAPALVERLEAARKVSGIPYKINSGCRCAPFNKIVGGAPASAHLYGYAADVAATTSRTRYLVLLGLLAAGFARIEITPTHIHADIAQGEVYPQQVCLLPTTGGAT